MTLMRRTPSQSPVRNIQLQRRDEIAAGLRRRRLWFVAADFPDPQFRIEAINAIADVDDQIDSYGGR